MVELELEQELEFGNVFLWVWFELKTFDFDSTMSWLKSEFSASPRVAVRAFDLPQVGSRAKAEVI